MGFFSGLVKTVLPIAGAALGGPLGGMAGAALGGFVGGDSGREVGQSLGTQFGNAVPGMINSGYAASQQQEVSDYQKMLNERQQGNFERQLGFNADEAQKGREFNAAEAEKNRWYQQAMSNTQYQRAVGDMEAAGLNPMLAYSQGGAGNVSGATASGGQASASSAPSLENAPALGAGTGARVAEVLQSLRSSDADIQLKKAAVGKTIADTDQSIASAANTRQLTSNLFKESDRISADIQVKLQQANTEVDKQRLLMAQRDLAKANTDYTRGQITYQEYIRRQEAAKATLLEKDINKASAWSDYYGTAMGRAYPYQQQVESGVNSAARIFKPF